MSAPAGFVVRLSTARQHVFEEQINEDTFAEPVPEFSHSRNVPLVCFVVNGAFNLTHIALGKRGRLAGTDLRRLNLEQIVSLSKPIPIATINAHSSARFRKTIARKLDAGGLLPPKSFEELMQIVSSLDADVAPILMRYSGERIRRIENLPSKAKEVLAEQKEALATALSIAGINRDELLGWDLNVKGDTSSFLDGLQQARLREDPMVINDLMRLPGYETIKSTPYNSVVFENAQSKLTVVLANRLPLEEQLGVDLIYYNETFSCFLLVQYKAMEQEGEGNEAIYRFPNEQLSVEIKRMKSILTELGKCPVNTEADGFRLSENPFFLKLCPRIVFNPDNVGLVKGMYLPLDYWEMLSEHPSMVGPREGKRVSYKNVRRYLDNTDFITIASGGWVGTNIYQSKLLEAAIKSTLESGRAVVFAVNLDKDERHRQN